MVDEHTRAEAALKRIEELGGHYVWEPELCVVYFSESTIQDSDVRTLLDVPAIEQLCFENSPLSDAIFDDLKLLPNLESLVLINTNVTRLGIDGFQAAKPNVRITTEVQNKPNPFTGAAPT